MYTIIIHPAELATLVQVKLLRELPIYYIIFIAIIIIGE